MKTFEFAIVASGLDHEADDFEDRFYRAGCDDATISFVRGVIVLEFAREAVSLDHAIRSAIANVRTSGATVHRVEPDYLVNLSDIAERAHLTRAAISLYAKGDRAAGFPAPVARVTTESPLWDWMEVAQWLQSHGKLGREELQEAQTIRSLNGSLSSSNFASA